MLRNRSSSIKTKHLKNLEATKKKVKNTDYLLIEIKQKMQEIKYYFGSSAKIKDLEA